MNDGLVVTAAEPGNAGSGTCPGTDRTTVSGKAANTFFFMQGDEVGEQQGAVEFFLVSTCFFGVFDDRQGDGHTLIATAGIDDYGQLTAVHAGVRTGSGSGPGPDMDVLAIGFEQRLADIGTIVIF